MNAREMLMPFSPLRMLLLAFALGFLILFVQIGLVSIAFDKLGLSEESAYLLLLSTLAGSLVNIPLFSLTADNGPAPEIPPELQHWQFFKLPPIPGKIIVTINIGGAIVPVAFSLYLLAHDPLNLLQVVAAVAAVTFIAYKVSTPVPGFGIGMPTLVAPLAAALIAALIAPEQRAPLAYVGGTLGVLIGADLLRLGDIRKMETCFAAIGGAGSFDGIYITGLIAVLLA